MTTSPPNNAQPWQQADDEQWEEQESLRHTNDNQSPKQRPTMATSWWWAVGRTRSTPSQQCAPVPQTASNHGNKLMMSGGKNKKHSVTAMCTSPTNSVQPWQQADDEQWKEQEALHHSNDNQSPKKHPTMATRWWWAVERTRTSLSQQCEPVPQTSPNHGNKLVMSSGKNKKHFITAMWTSPPNIAQPWQQADDEQWKEQEALHHSNDNKSPKQHPTMATSWWWAVGRTKSTSSQQWQPVPQTAPNLGNKLMMSSGKNKKHSVTAMCTSPTNSVQPWQQADDEQWKEQEALHHSNDNQSPKQHPTMATRWWWAVERTRTSLSQQCEPVPQTAPKHGNKLMMSSGKNKKHFITAMWTSPPNSVQPWQQADDEQWKEQEALHHSNVNQSPKQRPTMATSWWWAAQRKRSTSSQQCAPVPQTASNHGNKVMMSSGKNKNLLITAMWTSPPNSTQPWQQADDEKWKEQEALHHSNDNQSPKQHLTLATSWWWAARNRIATPSRTYGIWQRFLNSKKRRYALCWIVKIGYWAWKFSCCKNGLATRMQQINNDDINVFMSNITFN